MLHKSAFLEINLSNPWPTESETLRVSYGISVFVILMFLFWNSDTHGDVHVDIFTAPFYVGTLFNKLIWTRLFLSHWLYYYVFQISNLIYKLKKKTNVIYFLDQSF